MHKELFGALNRTLWGRRYVSIKDGKGKRFTLIAKDLELKDKIWIDFIYEQALSDGRENKLVPVSELAVFLEDAGLWTKQDNEAVKNMRNSLSKIGEALKDPDITKREFKSTERIKESILKSLNEKMVLKNELNANSLETFAETQRVHATLVSMLYSTESDRYWKTWQDFENETDNRFINNAIQAVFDKQQLTTKMVREIARSPEWRFKWNAYKNSGNMFGKALMNLTADQESLVYWSQVYDAAYESMDRPADIIINDDDALDKWFEEQSKKRKRDEIERKKDSPSRIGSSNIWRHGEVGIVTNAGLKGDLARAEKLGIGKKDTRVMSVEEINELNTPLAKKFRKAQRDKIQKHGIIEERDLRSDPNSRRVIGSKDAVFKKARRKDGFTGKQVTDQKPGGTLQGRRE